MFTNQPFLFNESGVATLPEGICKYQLVFGNISHTTPTTPPWKTPFGTTTMRIQRLTRNLGNKIETVTLKIRLWTTCKLILFTASYIAPINKFPIKPFYVAIQMCLGWPPNLKPLPREIIGYRGSGFSVVRFLTITTTFCKSKMKHPACLPKQNPKILGNLDLHSWILLSPKTLSGFLFKHFFNTPATIETFYQVIISGHYITTFLPKPRTSTYTSEISVLVG